MRLSIDARARGLLRRLPLNIAYSALELALMALLAVQAARLIWAIVTPVGPLGDWRLPPAGVGAAAPELLARFDPFFRLGGGATAAAPVAVTALQLTLFGTRLNEASGRGSAIIAGADGVQTSFAVGEEVAPGVTLKAVYFDHVTLTRGGRDEQLFLDQSAGGGGTVAADGAAPGEMVDAPTAPGVSLARLRAEIGFIPRIDNGQVTGLVVRPQGSGQLFRQVGLKDGDIVTQIGGRPVTGPGDIDKLAGQYAKGGNIPLSVERGAEVLPIVISVSGA